MRIEVKDFNLEDSVTCGQIFRYSKEDDGSFTIVLSDRVVNVKEDNGFLVVDSNVLDNLKEVIVDYFDLSRDYDSINNVLKNDDALGSIIDNCKGFKTFRTPRFETVISYVISQNNSVRAIRNSVNLLSIKYGKRVLFRGNEYYLFPDVSKLKDVSISEYRDYKVGFRDKYIYGVVQSILSGDLDLNLVCDLSTSDAFDYFVRYKGIGNKVASCILLFGYQRLDVFPVDTWVKKWMFDNYGISNQGKIEEFARNRYGKYSGLAIQYMFHSSRNK